MFARKVPSTPLLLLFLLIGMLCSYKSSAQATPDTSLNKIVPDSANRKGNVTVINGDTTSTRISTVKLTNIDTTPALAVKKGPFQPNPKKAGMYSALLPGAGQYYNRQYWKIPVIYVGLGVAGYFFLDNLHNYQNYHTAYIGRLGNQYIVDKYTNIYTTANLKQLQDDYQRYLDLTVLFTGVGYVLQILDAVTFAYLKNFDVSRDISMRIYPAATPHGAGIGLVMNFK
ncbi:MAG: hypothetical protein H0X33_10990 [Taibaiella sp.]|nr:hypothetical protein [Taibaiella sp.]